MRWMRARPARGAAALAPVIAGVLAALLMAARLLLPVPVGMANNGDAVRLMCQIGANSHSPPWPTSQLFFVRFWYPFARPGSGPPCLYYPTTQVLQTWLTAWIHQHVLGLPGVIDMRELIIEYCVLVGVAIAITTRLLAALRPTARILILIMLFLVLSEATFADYAASPFTETAALYGMLVFAIAGVAVAERAPGYHAAYLVAWASAVLAVGAKTETTTLALPLALFLGSRRFPAGSVRGRYSGRLIPGLCMLSLAMTAYWSLSREPINDARTNSANELTMTIMPMVRDAGAAAAEFGLPRAFGRYSGTNWWSAHPIENDPAYPRYQGRFTQSNLARYLTGRPGLTARIFASGAGPYLTFRNTNLGSYPIDSGHAPRSQECRDCLLMDISRAMRWTGLAGVLAYWTACLAAAGLLVRGSRPGDRRRGFALVALVLTGCTVIQYVTAVYGEGNEVIKHMVIALFTASIAPIWLLADALHKLPRAGLPLGSGEQDSDLVVVADRARAPQLHQPGQPR
jgi:hypothetical protein